MLSTISSFDRRTAAGILARAAAYVENDRDPVAQVGILENEHQLRRSVIAEILDQFGLSSTDLSEENRHRLAAALDSESDSLLGPVDQEASLQRLGRLGELPSDLYELIFEDGLKSRLGGHFMDEALLAKETVRYAEREQHLGEVKDAPGQSLISLFSKYYPNTKFPSRGFTLLVVGRRNGHLLLVAQVWRVYRDLVDTSGAKDLLDVLRLFFNRFGHRVNVNGQTGFFLQSTMDAPKDGRLAGHIEFTGSADPNDELAFFQFAALTADNRTQLVTMGMNLTKYYKAVMERGWDLSRSGDVLRKR